MARQQPRDRTVAPAPAPRKKPYRTPKLEEYGDLRTITRSPKGGTMNDDPTPPATRK